MKSRLVSSAVFFVVALGSALLAAPGCSAGAGSGSDGVGKPCVPVMENDATFLGFQEREVNLETSSPSCATSVCLINHFRGRVSCPYGQSADGMGAGGVNPCKTPSKGAPVTGNANDRLKAQIPAQCVDRAADKAVYCSCRCANGNGRTDDGQQYCSCPDGFACTSAVTSIGSGTSDIAGSYCVKNGTVYDANTACNQGDCDPVAKKCE